MNNIPKAEFIRRTRQALLLSTGISLIVAPAAVAQNAAPLNSSFTFEEILVTARKRDETLISAPVAVTAVTGTTLERRGINNMDGLARLVPQLVVGEGGGTVQGGIIALRGIAGAEANPFADQAVSFVIDGVQVARASVRRMSEMDVAQIEVLKGPQALFFGKNSPGGVISIRTADPTDELSAKATAGYEFNGREWRGDGYISGPLTDTLGFRLSVYGSTMQGWVKSIVPENAPLQPRSRRAPEQDEYAVRGTLKFEPSDSFNARLKLTYNKRTGDSAAANVQFVDCPTGAPQTGGIDECKANDLVSVASPGPGFSQFDSRIPEDGKTLLRQTQILGGLEMNYAINDALTLTSVTGFYKVDLTNWANYTASYIGGSMLSSLNTMYIREASEELRLTSNFDGPVNFTLGGHYQDSRANTTSHTFLGTPGTLAFGAFPGPIQINEYRLEQKGTAYSFFGQIMVDILPTVELSGGGRYSHEKKTLPLIMANLTPPTAGGGALALVSGMERLTSLSDRVSFNNFSPEVTLAWRPNETLTVFGSYKQGFLSGGFNSGSANFLTNLTYEPEKVKGFEGGIKASLLDGTLLTNLTLFTYKVTGLQVAVTTAGVVQELKNAGSVRTKGAEFDFNYLTPLDGLSLHGAIAYNRGRYLDYQASCHRGQHANSPVPCTNQISRVTGQVALLQDLSGTELMRAPEWTGNLGAFYEAPIASNLRIGLSGDMTYSDSYLTDASSKAAGRSPSYTLFDAAVHLSEETDRWRVSLIGRNLTNKFYWTRNSDNPFSGTDAGVIVGARLGDTVAPISRGREIMLNLSYKY